MAVLPSGKLSDYWTNTGIQSKMIGWIAVTSIGPMLEKVWDNNDLAKVWPDGNGQSLGQD